MDKAQKKEIKVLSEKEHILLRPTVYIGSVKPSDEKIPIIRGNRLYIENMRISVGMYKLFDEVFSNSLDEAKRLKGRMKKILIEVNSGENSILVRDTGDGFYKGTEINKATNLSNIETAVSQLRAGSNFDNEDEEDALLGTNGMGVSLVNVFSKYFYIDTTNDEYRYIQEWNNFVRTPPIIYKKGNKDEKGTTVKFIPLPDIFEGQKWDRDALSSMLILKYDLIKRDPILNKLKIVLKWDGEEIDLEQKFLPDDSFRIDTDIGQIAIWEKYEGSGSISFVNSAMCTGIHQKIINDYINQKLDDNLGHHFYDTLIVLNLPPRYVEFGDQNKTRYITPRETIEGLLYTKMISKLHGFFKTELYARILKKVQERKNEGYIKKLRSEKKKINIKSSHKYFPAQKIPGENLFIVEGLSAMGSILQKRNPRTDGIYALKGKIKNCKNIGDLSDNKEILELMQILGLDPLSKRSGAGGYKKIIIATDPDPDGSHIASLIINLFYRWFTDIIREKRLAILRIPLVSTGDGKNRRYFWDMEEFKGAKPAGNIRYLKGLGSLSIEDWEWVMNNKFLVTIEESMDSKEKLEMAFGDSPELRKKWLENKI